MKNMRKFQPAEKATVCIKDNCVTVYDETANIVNVVAIVSAVVVGFALIVKAFR